MYSVGIYLVLCIIPKAEVAFSAKTLVRQMLPILTDQYWFFTCYILLMCKRSIGGTLVDLPIFLDN